MAEKAGDEHPAGIADGPALSGAAIRVLDGFYEGLEIPIDRDRLVVGRGKGVDVMIAEPTISRAHVALGREGGGVFVRDLGSTNGTLVNGSRCEHARLRDGDEIQLGKLRLRVRLYSAR